MYWLRKIASCVRDSRINHAEASGHYCWVEFERNWLDECQRCFEESMKELGILRLA